MMYLFSSTEKKRSYLTYESMVRRSLSLRLLFFFCARTIFPAKKRRGLGGAVSKPCDKINKMMSPFNTLIALSLLFIAFEASSASPSTLQDLHDYDLVVPSTSANAKRNLIENGHLTRGERQHLRQLSIAFETKSRGEIHLDVERADDILAPRYTHLAIGNGEKKTVHGKRDDVEMCYYRGKVRGFENASIVALNTCGHGIDAFVKIEGNTYAIAPASLYGIPDRRRRDQESLDVAPHIFFDVKERRNMPLLKCGVADASDDEKRLLGHSPELHLGASKEHRSLGTKARVVELLMVSSSNQFNSACEASRRVGGQGGSCNPIEETQSRAIQIAVAVKEIYETLDLGITIVLVAHTYFESENAEKDANTYVSASGDIGTLLNKFTSWHRKNNNGILLSDNAQLIDNTDRNGGTAGLAWKGTMCTSSSSGVNEDKGLYQYTVETVAHEMGHNFGMHHDGDAKDNNNCNSKNFIMASSSVVAPFFSRSYRTFSSCSKSEVTALLQRLESGTSCLANDPHREPLGGPVCGDGILSPVEE